ncbi:uncharacterized protein LOC111333151 [Stylophora pistillata]|uniref:uncharacterized protein LOC111333151 n=1 Tax=Stylophora pistillata TaxID=50429 RepID=UPI000C03A056|nr:uncharacterized protein LOC111333151 [Stylophora pistillata]
MVSNNYYLAATLFLSFGVLSAGIEIKRVKYCGPPDNTFKLKIFPGPVLTRGKYFNISVTFTPAVDIFYPTIVLKAHSKRDHHIYNDKVFNPSSQAECHVAGFKLCNFPAGVTQTWKYQGIYDIVDHPKGDFIFSIRCYNDDEALWFCLEGEAVL